MARKITYEDWMREIDKILKRKVGVGQDDLVDWPSRDAYDDGLTPVQGASRCLKAQD
jgi:hypothetical protein